MLIDQTGRPITCLRLSVTSECNLQCFYCRPGGTVLTRVGDPPLSDREIVRLCRLLVSEGITRIRITGGEPLIRPGVLELVHAVAGLRGLEEISLTTNGLLLSRYAAGLVKAGVSRVNVSLDSLVEERFRRITGYGSPNLVLGGIAEARRQGLEPVKINVVVMRGVNDDEVVDFARLTLDTPVHVRFIELMPIGPARDIWETFFLANAEVRRTLEKEVGLLPAEPVFSRYGTQYRIPGAAGKIVFISPVTEPFCGSCDRIRMTASGELRPCLRSDSAVNVAAMLRSGATDEQLILAVRCIVALKGTPSEEDVSLPAMFCTGG